MVQYIEQINAENLNTECFVKETWYLQVIGPIFVWI